MNLSLSSRNRVNRETHCTTTLTHQHYSACKIESIVFLPFGLVLPSVARCYVPIDGAEAIRRNATRKQLAFRVLPRVFVFREQWNTHDCWIISVPRKFSAADLSFVHSIHDRVKELTNRNGNWCWTGKEWSRGSRWPVLHTCIYRTTLLCIWISITMERLIIIVITFTITPR